jgi:hypothetical protein
MARHAGVTGTLINLPVTVSHHSNRCEAGVVMTSIFEGCGLFSSLLIPSFADQFQ